MSKVLYLSRLFLGLRQKSNTTRELNYTSITLLKYSVEVAGNMNDRKRLSVSYLFLSIRSYVGRDSGIRVADIGGAVIPLYTLP